MSPNRRSKEIITAPWVCDLLADTKSDIAYCHAGLGAGKTFGYALKHYNWITQNCDSQRSWFIEPTYALVEQAAIPIWREVLKLLGLREGKHFKFINAAPQKLYIYTGVSTHTVFFLSADRPQYFVATTIGYVTIDEVGSVKSDVVTYALQRLRDAKANYVQAGLCGVPQGMNHFADRANFVGRNEELNEVAFQATTYSNQHNLAESYIRNQLKEFGHNPAKVRSWIHGIFSSFFEGQACPEYDPDRDRHELEADRHVPITLSLDYNVQPMAWTAWQKRLFEPQPKWLAGGIKHCSVGESNGKDGTITDAIIDFVAQFDPRKFKATPIRVTGDASGHQRSVRGPGTHYDFVFKILKEFYHDVEIIAPPHNPPVDIRVEITNRAFSYGEVLIHKAHTNTNNSLLKTQWVKNERKLKKPSGEEITHWFDEVGYYLCQEYAQTQSSLVKAPKYL